MCVCACVRVCVVCICVCVCIRVCVYTCVCNVCTVCLGTREVWGQGDVPDQNKRG